MNSIQMRKRIASLEQNPIISVGELKPLLAGLRQYRPHLNLQRLQIRLGKREEPTYSQFIGNDFWFALEVKKFIAEEDYGFWNIDEVGKQCAQHAIDILHAHVGDFSHFDTVTTLVMGDASQPTKLDEITKISEEQYCIRVGMGISKPLPQVLVDFPNVQHYCQADAYGPLALLPLTFQCSTPPQIYTFHPRPVTPLCLCLMKMPPIVIGSINRYYYGVPTTIVGATTTNPWTADTIANLLAPILRPLTIRKDIARIQYRRPVKSVAPETINLDGTCLELYDFIRVVEGIEGDANPRSATQIGHCPRACRPARSLAPLQRELDKVLPREWRGRVFLKNREEAPPCSACGLDLMDEWDEEIEKKKERGYFGIRDITCMACGIF